MKTDAESDVGSIRLLACPYCGECDYDLVGLKSHLLKGECEQFDVIPIIRSSFEELDGYGNPVDGSEIRNCCFPDCGCDGSRNCMAKGRPNTAASVLNIERGSPACFGKEYNA